MIEKNKSNIIFVLNKFAKNDVLILCENQNLHLKDIIYLLFYYFKQDNSKKWVIEQTRRIAIEPKQGIKITDYNAMKVGFPLQYYVYKNIY